MAVYSTAGDRRDCDMIRQGELLGAAFDRVILYEDHYRRGRAEGEIMGLFRKGVESSARAKEIIEIVGATKAAEAALNMVEPGELLLLQADKIDETMDWIKQYISTMVEQKAAAQELIDEAVASPVSAGYCRRGKREIDLKRSRRGRLGRKLCGCKGIKTYLTAKTKKDAKKILRVLLFFDMQCVIMMR